METIIINHGTDGSESGMVLTLDEYVCVCEYTLVCAFNLWEDSTGSCKGAGKLPIS